MPVTIGAICDAIVITFQAAMPSPLLVRVESYNQITEGINAADCPLLQVYPEDGTIDQRGGETDRTTFGGGVRHKMVTINCDFYATQRGHIGEGIERTVDLIDRIIDVFEEQNLKPYFNIEGLKAFSVAWNRVQFDYAGALYPGARFVITGWIF